MSDACERSNDVRVESWCDLCERLCDNSWQDSLLRFRPNYAFRGLSDKSFRHRSRAQLHTVE